MRLDKLHGEEPDPYKLPRNPYKIPKQKEPDPYAPIKATKLKWIPPSLSDELQEIQFHAGNQELLTNIDELTRAFHNGRLITLDDATWAQLENTDSRQHLPISDMTKLAKTAYNKTEDGIYAIVNTMHMGGTMKAPTVWFRDGYPPFLIGGNTRLMAAKALGIRPKVWAIKT